MARPPKLTDTEIGALIAELRQPHRAPTGVAVRKELMARYGIRAGTQRVYRLLSAPPPPPPPIDPSEAARHVAELTAARDAALRRAELAEYRERATQDRTANQIHELRAKLRRLGVDPFA
jgi:hypothetical protein